jgi:hypothetical protein
MMCMLAPQFNYTKQFASSFPTIGNADAADGSSVPPSSELLKHN